MITKQRHLFLGILFVITLLFNEALSQDGRPPVEAMAFQNADEGHPTSNSVLGFVLAQDSRFAPSTNEFGFDYFATGTSRKLLDALSLVFDPCSESSNYRLRVYLQKGAYPAKQWEWYQLLPGTFNTTNEDFGIRRDEAPVHPPSLPPGMVDIAPLRLLPDNRDLGWIEMPFNTSSDARYVLGDGRIGVTLRLWNFRVDAIELVCDCEPQVKIERQDKSWDPATSSLTHTLVLQNRGCEDAVRYRVTSQPYNIPTNDLGIPVESAQKQTKADITIPAGQFEIVTFTFSAQDGKDWKWQNTYLYDGLDDGKHFVDGTVGTWAGIENFESGDGRLEYFFSYPDAVRAVFGGAEAKFRVTLIDQMLPDGWSILRMDPAPDQAFTVSASRSKRIQIIVRPDDEPQEGELAALDFEFVQHDSGVRVRSRVGLTFASRESKKQSFVAYNDLSWGEGQLFKKITRYTTNNGSGTPPDGNSGLLIDLGTGKLIPVALTVTGGAWNGSTHTVQGDGSRPGTEAYGIFHGMVDVEGVTSYADTDLEIAFSGLDPSLRYEAILFGNRNRSSYSDRLSKTTISGVVHMENTSTQGSGFVGLHDESTTIAHGYNREEGYVTRFSNIDPGSDGRFVLTVSDGGSSSPSKFYANALRLKAAPKEAEYVTQIGFSNLADGEQDVTEFLADETLYIRVRDVAIDLGFDVVARVEAKLIQADVKVTTELSFNAVNRSYVGNVTLHQFSAGEVDIDVSGAVGTDTFLHRASRIFIQGE